MPSIFANSTYFVYANRGLWALIMAQTGLGIYGACNLRSQTLTREW
jgi:hypothetical protein